MSLWPKIPPAIFGCIDFILPSKISGNFVIDETETTEIPAPFKAFAVPPVAIIFIFFFFKNFPKETSPDLSETDKRAVFGIIFYSFFPQPLIASIKASPSSF